MEHRGSDEPERHDAGGRDERAGTRCPKELGALIGLPQREQTRVQGILDGLNLIKK